MKTYTGTLLAAGAALGLGAYAYFVEYKGGEQKKEQSAKDAQVLRFEAKDLARVELVRNSGSVVLEKNGDAWKMTAPVNDSVEPETVRTFVDQLASEKSSETVIEGDSINWSTYGLDRPMTRLLTKTADGRSREIKIGAIKSFDNQLYARRDEEKAVLLVSSSWDIHLSKPVKDLRDKRLLRTDRTDFDKIRIASGGKTRLVLIKKNDDWSFEVGGDPTIPVSDAQVTSYLEQLKGLRATDFVAELSGPGFDAKGMPTVDAKRFGFGGQEPLLIELSKNGDASPVRFAVSGLKPSALSKESVNEDESTRFALSSAIGAVLKLARSTVDEADKDAQAFYDRKFPFMVDLASVKGVEIKASGIKTPASVLLAKKNGEKWEAKDLPGDLELDPSKLEDLIGRVSRMEAQRYLGRTQAKGVDQKKSQIALLDDKGAILLRLNWGDVFEEKPKSGGTPTKLQYVKTSRSEQTFAVTDGEISGLPLKDLLKEKPKPAPPQQSAAPGAGTAPAAQASAVPTKQPEGSKKN